MLQTARDLPARTVWFLTVRVVEVGLLAVLVGALLEAHATWTYAASYVSNGDFPSTSKVPLAQRLSGLALFNGYRLPISLVIVAVVLAAILVVLHRGQPVVHTRELRWEWLVLWGLTTVLALLVTVIGVVALLLDDPTKPPPGTIVGPSFGPGYHEQVLTNLGWPLGALLLLVPLALWWARLPDMDDLDDALAGAQVAEDGTRHPVTVVSGMPGPVVSSSSSSSSRTAGPTPARTRFGTRSTRDDDTIRADEVEQIEPVERLSPRGSDPGDGSSSNGYEGYFRR